MTQIYAKVWSARGRDSTVWHACSANRPPHERAALAYTKCKVHLMLPSGYEMRRPTCRKCRAQLAGDRRRSP